MAQKPGAPRFPSPIPNPLAETPKKAESQHQSVPNAKPQPKQKTPANQTPPKAAPIRPSSIADADTPPMGTPLPNPSQPLESIPDLDLGDPEETTDPNLRAPDQIPPETPPTPRIKLPEMGILDPLMRDPAISEIMVNDLRNIMIEKGGKLLSSGLNFNTIEELNRITRNILDVTGRILSPDQPYVDVALPDGSRVNIVTQPLTLGGPCITIRKFPLRRLGIQDLINNKMVDQRIAYFLNVCVVGRLNILVSGGTGSGKTTLLNVLSSFVPKKERIICIEDTPELQIQHLNSVKLQTKPQTAASEAITARELVANSLRMRPDRIIVGECRRSEAFDMLQAMNTGHSGSMTTLHANSVRDALSRVETLCLLAGIDLPITAIRKQIVSAIDLVVQIHRYRDGTRRVKEIAEVTGMEADTVTLQDIFTFETDQTVTGAGGGRFKATGLVPTFIDRLRDQGIELPRNYFG